jgi:hypothetical protein
MSAHLERSKAKRKRSKFVEHLAGGERKIFFIRMTPILLLLLLLSAAHTKNVSSFNFHDVNIQHRENYFAKAICIMCFTYISDDISLSGRRCRRAWDPE